MRSIIFPRPARPMTTRLSASPPGVVWQKSTIEVHTVVLRQYHHRKRLHYNCACSNLDSSLVGGPRRLPSLQTKGSLVTASSRTFHFTLTSRDPVFIEQSATYPSGTGTRLKSLQAIRWLLFYGQDPLTAQHLQQQ